MLRTAYLSLGSNMGDRARNLQRARANFQTAELRMLRESSIYETEPRDVLGQPWFLNQVIELETSLFPRQLLARLQNIEREMGRRRIVAKGPRVIDLDILLLGEVVMATPELGIPHPRLAERRFVLEPLAELAPELCLPGRAKDGRTVREMLADVRDQPVRRL